VSGIVIDTVEGVSIESRHGATFEDDAGAQHRWIASRSGTISARRCVLEAVRASKSQNNDRWHLFPPETPGVTRGRAVRNMAGIKARRELIDSAKAAELVASVPHWHHTFEIAPGVWTPGSYNPGFMLAKLHLPEDLSGRRVLDIGPSDGFFSLVARKRGADVVCVDYRSKSGHGFQVMEQLSGYDFDYFHMNIYDIRREKLGTFDYVFFLGVLYHLPDMMRALAIVRSVCDGELFLESHTAVNLLPDVAVARYYRSDSLAGDRTNFWSPNPLCIRDMLGDAAFSVVRDETWGDRYFAHARISGAEAVSEKLQLGYGLVGGVKPEAASLDSAPESGSADMNRGEQQS